ncbi:hypothetical protein, partial [Escherichia coli]|uniref:hypothetical protein n=1 Tax=Escherichia coli TaxID=562 RepID=UPI0035901D10
SDGNGSHASTLKSPSYTKSVSWQHYHAVNNIVMALKKDQQVKSTGQTSLASIKIISGILSEEKTLF